MDPGGGGFDPAMLAAMLGGKGGGKGGGAGGLAAMLGPNIWDSPMVAGVAFHPSSCEAQYLDATSGPVRDGLIPVSGGDKVAYRLYVPSGEAKAVIYMWHGNAEVCTSGDMLQDTFKEAGIALLSLDYRGYAWGTGQPSLTKLCSDAEVCFTASEAILKAAGCNAAKRIVMGRSIGATCAVHIAAKRAARVHGLIVDSGLMSIKELPMVKQMAPMVLGSPDALNALPDPHDTVLKLGAVSCPALVMHGHRDEIVPFAQGELCHSSVASLDKTFKAWASAGHNDVLMLCAADWMGAVKDLVEKACAFTITFPAGATVETHSLSATELNGLQGRVVGFQGEERVRVELPAPTGEKALKRSNLKLITEEVLDSPEAFPIGALVEAHSLSSGTFNGLQGKVAGYQGDRVSVEFPEPNGTKGLKPANLKIV
eukprot:TRINITY_DN102330_c0_g1_i1.p1 TRINITY_DN102330_c0_g1~~TRINITY_DN102330_c0_g1_i1.p1  ORF type:complete len:426 (-),score=66.92 TRINITY_DN102330_c0_g1_i1:128-1405(-)